MNWHFRKLMDDFDPSIRSNFRCKNSFFGSRIIPPFFPIHFPLSMGKKCTKSIHSKCSNVDFVQVQLPWLFDGHMEGNLGMPGMRARIQWRSRLPNLSPIGVFWTQKTPIAPPFLGDGWIFVDKSCRKSNIPLPNKFLEFHLFFCQFVFCFSCQSQLIRILIFFFDKDLLIHPFHLLQIPGFKLFDGLF